MRTLIPILLGGLLLSGCGRGGDNDGAKTLRIAYAMGPSELIHQSARRFAELVKERSGGRIAVRIYPGGQLGNDQGVVEGVKLGSIDIAITGAAPIGWYAPEYGLIEAPFVWKSYEHAQRVWDGEIGQDLKRVMKERAKLDLHNLWFRGPRYLTTTSRKIHTPENLKGLKLRVPELPVYMKSWRTFGANTTPLPFSDLFMALKLRQAEGQENPLATIYGNNLHEVQKYIMETRHLIGFFILLTGEHWAKRFTAAEREMLAQAMRDAAAWHNRRLEESEAEFREKLTDAGVEFVPVDRDAFLELAKKEIPPQFEGSWKPGLYEKIVTSE
jgi:TRAP-type transport system periplasmic protein